MLGWQPERAEGFAQGSLELVRLMMKSWTNAVEPRTGLWLDLKKGWREE